MSLPTALILGKTKDQRQKDMFYIKSESFSVENVYFVPVLRPEVRPY